MIPNIGNMKIGDIAKIIDNDLLEKTRCVCEEESIIRYSTVEKRFFMLMKITDILCCLPKTLEGNGKKKKRKICRTQIEETREWLNAIGMSAYWTSFHSAGLLKLNMFPGEFKDVQDLRRIIPLETESVYNEEVIWEDILKINREYIETELADLYMNISQIQEKCITLSKRKHQIEKDILALKIKRSGCNIPKVFIKGTLLSPQKPDYLWHAAEEARKTTTTLICLPRQTIGVYEKSIEIDTENIYFEKYF